MAEYPPLILSGTSFVEADETVDLVLASGLVVSGNMSASSYAFAGTSSVLVGGPGIGITATLDGGKIKMVDAVIGDSTTLEHQPGAYFLITTDTGLIRFNEPTQILDTLLVLGTAQLNDDVNCVADLSANGHFEANSTAQFDGAVSANSTAEFNGTTQFDGAVTANSTVEFNGTTQFDASAEFNAYAQFDGAILTTGAANLDGKNTIGGDSTFNNTVDFNNPVIANSTVEFNSTTQFDASAEFNAVAQFDSTVTINGTTNCLGTFTSDLIANFNDDVEFNAGINVVQQATFEAGAVADGMVEGSGLRSTPAATAPSNPTEGQLYYSTSADQYFYYDSSRSKWLSMSTETYIWGQNGSVTNVYLLWAGSVLGAATNGVKSPHNLVLTSITATGGISKTFDLETRIAGVTQNTLVFTASTHEENDALDVDVPAGDVIALYVSGSSRYLGVYVTARRTL